MRKPFVWGRVLYIAGGILLFLVIIFFAFTNFFLDDILTSAAPKKINEAIRVITHGRFIFHSGRITYEDGKIMCRNVELVRLRYDTSEQSVTLKRAYADTVRFTGVSLWGLLWGEEVSMKSMEINTPEFTLSDAAKEQHSPDVIHDTIQLPVTSFDSVVLNDIHIILPELLHPTQLASMNGMRLKLSGFFFNPESLEKAPLLYSKRVDFALSSANYLSADSFYIMQLHNLKASVADSLLTIDSITYKPNYSEDIFAQKHKYQTGSITFHCAGVRMEGINVRRLSMANGVEFHKFETASWDVSTYLDRRRPPDPHPPPIDLPNDLLSSMPFALNADSIIWKNGKITVRERAPGSLQPGMLYFDRAHLLFTPVTNDSQSKKYGEPTHISFNAYFVGEALLRSSWTYPMLDKSFDLNIHATLGSFHAKKLNTWLVPFERIEVTDGILDSGKIDINIRSGKGTTTVIPYYRNFSMNMLSADVHKGRGLLEGLKTFWAKIFIVRANNSSEQGKSIKSGTTTLVRTRDEDLMQYIWLSIRKSLGQVIGGFQ